MAEYITNDTDLKSVADAIRAKTGKTDPLTYPTEFVSEIAGIETGGTDLSLGLTGAAAGQIAKISAVDENGKPTAWEKISRKWQLQETWNVKDMTFPAWITAPDKKDSFIILEGTDLTADNSTKINVELTTATHASGYGGRFSGKMDMYAHGWGCGGILMLLYCGESTRFYAKRTMWASGYDGKNWFESSPVGETDRNGYRIVISDATIANLNKDTTAKISLYVRDALC